MQTFDVEVVVTRRVGFFQIEALSPESAESTAEAYIRDGESGQLICEEIESCEAHPSEPEQLELFN